MSIRGGDVTRPMDMPLEEAFRLLREPFLPEQIGKLPRLTCKACSDATGRVCNQHRKERCAECGNYITVAHIHLDYVGHAAITDRLLAVDPAWSWEPYAVGPDGLPLLTRDKALSLPGEEVGLWIRLTVVGVTRPGYGGGKNIKEAIGDALRNAAMRFGVALDLWHKDGILAPAPPDETPVQLDWGALMARVESRWGFDALESFKVFAAEARTQLFPDGNVDQPELYRVTTVAADALHDLPGDFPPPGREEMQSAFLQAAGLVLDGPEWAMSPEEHQAGRPLRDDAEPKEDGDAQT